ncbi:MAG: AgmX/PglI C-terminal domain-containing protein, partial [Deltaproteobacteria bacterium]|nr:AgmX/PglI C-terminal domain-containing protein [Deltaproteobacteria bacterium]
RFIIDRSGRVLGSAIASSSLHSRGTERCILAAIRRWHFPKLGANVSVVQVLYPFIFHPAGVQ